MVLIAFIILILLTSSETFKTKQLVKCYKCLRMTCDGQSIESDFCSSLHHFVQKSLKAFYHIEASEFSGCPNPIDDDLGWETLKTISPNTLTCPGPCALGRFQLTFMAEEERIINHGTVLGCAKVQLSDNIIYPNRRKTKKARELPCHWENVTSFVKLDEQVEVTMALEHCPRPGDICDYKDFCIDPRASLIIPFESDQKAKSHSGFVTWLICIACFVCLLVLIATFAGMKYTGG